MRIGYIARPAIAPVSLSREGPVMVRPCRPRLLTAAAVLTALPVLAVLGVVGCGTFGLPQRVEQLTAPTSAPAPGGIPPHLRVFGASLNDVEDDATPQAEAYEHTAENGFLSAQQNPLSTFSIDVDTASYSNVRRFLLTEHRLPPPDAVRVEELVNYFPYSYPRPDDGRPVAFTLDIAKCPWNSEHHLVRIGLAAARIEPEQMPPRNLVFLVDTSGSMQAPNRLPLLQQSLRMLVEQLGERDRVAIVSYAGNAGLVLPSTPGSRKKTILRAIDGLQAGGSTNGGEGIVLAYKVAQKSFLPYGVNRVILGTDGDFNVGVTSQEDLVRLIEAKRKSGVYLSLLGFGMGNLKDATLEKLAHHGNGHYAYIDSETEARKVFVEQGAALLTVAKDVKLQVEFNPARVSEYRLLGYENRLLKEKDFNNDKKDAGDMGAGHTVTAFYEIVPAGRPRSSAKADRLKYQHPAASPAGESDEWLTVKLRYKDPGAEKSRLLSQALGGPVRELEEMPADFRFASAVAAFGLLLRGSEHRGDIDYARVRKLARAALGADSHGHRAGFLEMIDAARELASPRDQSE
jgi:Ca-activated chloride channel family protein